MFPHTEAAHLTETIASKTGAFVHSTLYEYYMNIILVVLIFSQHKLIMAVSLTVIGEENIRVCRQHVPNKHCFYWLQTEQI